jgi:prevent-host-death family protein
MRRVNVLEAKTHFSALLREIALGDEVIITNHGRPVARLSPIEAPPRRRVYGALRAVEGRRAASEAEVAEALAPMSDDAAEASGWA